MKSFVRKLLRLLEDLPLRPTVAAALIIGLCLPVGISVWRDVQERRATLLQHLQMDHQLLADVLAISMQTPIWEVRPRSGQPLLDAIIRDDRVTSVTVTSPLIPQFLSSSEPERRGGTLLTRERPVVRDGETIGAVRLEMTTAPLEAEIAQQWAQVLVTGLMQTALGLLLIFPLLRLKVLSPLGRLVADSQALAAGELAKPFRWRRVDELGDLGRRFEATRQSLATLFSDLEQRNADLERKQGELAEQTAVLRAILDNMTDGITLVDRDLRLVAWNDRFVEMFRLPSDVVREGVAIADLYTFEIARGHFTEEAGEGYLRRLPTTYARERETEMQLRLATGQVVNVRRRPIPSGGYVSTYTDVTAEMEAVRKSEQALRLLEAVMDAVPAVLHVKDRHLRYQMVNRQFLAISGLERRDIIGKTMGEAFERERLRGYWDRDHEVVATGQPLPFHEAKVRLYGDAPWDALATKVPIVDEDGLVTHIVTVELDIGERKKAEAALRESEELYRLLVDLSPYGIMLHDSAGVVFLNRAGCRILGIADPMAAVGRHYLDFVAPAERDDAAARVFQSLEARQELPSAERRLVTADGREIDVAVVAVPFTRGGLRMALVMFRDISERKRMERALRESERHFRSLVEGHPLPVWVVDFESGALLYESPATAELFGRPSKAGEPRDVLRHWSNLEDRREFLRLLKEREELLNYEWHARKEDGTLFWVMVRSRRIHHDGRDLIVSSMFDMTERKQREAEMREARETLEDAIESLSEGFALFDPFDRLVICNTRYREFHARSRDLLVPGVTWTDFVTNAAERGEFRIEGKSIPEWVQSMLAQRRAGIRNMEIQHADGSWYQISHQRTRRGGTAVIRTEITHLKTMEQALRESEERFRGIAEAHPVPVVITTAEGAILYASPAAARLLRKPRGEIVGGDANAFYADADERRGFIETFMRQGYADTYEMRLKRADSTVFPAAVASRPIVYEGHQAIVSGVFDLTEQKAAEAEIAKQREALHQSEKLNALGSLLAGVAHELNNPLSVVVGRAIMLEGTDVDPHVASSVTKIRLAAERCARIVKTFLAMARQQAPSRLPVRMPEIIDATLDLVGYRLRSAGVEVVREMASDLPETMADPDQLTQVFSNLFLNAQQAMSEMDGLGPKVLRVACRLDPSLPALVIEVEDSGPGMPADVVSRIFEPFFTTKPPGVGTGIGLAVTRGIIQSHGGTITAASPQSGGACFRIVLPVQPVEGDAVAQIPARTGTRATGHILIVDDEPDIARMMADILAVDGHRVDVAGGGREALDAVAATAFDLVISDLIMPDVDGRGLYKRLSKSRPELVDRLVFMTGDTLSAAVRSFVDAVGRPLIEKPFTPGEVRRVVRKSLGGGGAVET